MKKKDPQALAQALRKNLLQRKAQKQQRVVKDILLKVEPIENTKNLNISPEV